MKKLKVYFFTFKVKKVKVLLFFKWLLFKFKENFKKKKPNVCHLMSVYTRSGNDTFSLLKKTVGMVFRLILFFYIFTFLITFLKKVFSKS